MSYPDVPYRTEPPKKVTEDEHGHHLSPWPIFLSFVIPILLIGIVTFEGDNAYTWIAPGLGLAAVLYGILAWTREDIHEWPKGPNPLTWHTVGEKDNVWWGIVLFLGTEVVLFGSLFAVWFQAKAAAGASWPTHEIELLAHALPKVIINTVILVASGVVMHLGEMALKKDNRKGFLFGFAGAVVLGLIFLYGQVAEYIELIGDEMTLGSSLVASAFYVLTGTHGLHVTVGVLLLLIAFVRGMQGQFTKERHEYITAAAYYWHFVDFVWIVLVFVVYVAPVYGWY